MAREETISRRKRKHVCILCRHEERHCKMHNANGLSRKPLFREEEAVTHSLSSLLLLSSLALSKIKLHHYSVKKTKVIEGRVKFKTPMKFEVDKLLH